VKKESERSSKVVSPKQASEINNDFNNLINQKAEEFKVVHVSG